MEEILNFIGGKFTPCSSGQSIDNLCPATGEVYSKIPRSDATDVDIAVAAAESAQPAWSALSRNERSAWLVRIAEAIESLRSDHGHPDTEGDDEDEDEDEDEYEGENDPPVTKELMEEIKSFLKENDTGS